MFPQGQVVLDHKKVYVWHYEMFDGKPFFITADKIKIELAPDAEPDVASKVEDYTPTFRELVTLKPGLVAARAKPTKATPAPQDVMARMLGGVEEDSGSDSEDREDRQSPEVC